MHLSRCKPHRFLEAIAFLYTVQSPLIRLESEGARRDGRKRRDVEEKAAKGEGNGRKSSEKKVGSIFRRCNQCAREPFSFPFSMAPWMGMVRWCPFSRGALIKDPSKAGDLEADFTKTGFRRSLLPSSRDFCRWIFYDDLLLRFVRLICSSLGTNSSERQKCTGEERLIYDQNFFSES